MKLPLPTEALDDRLAIVGRSGYGKTNAAKVMAERLLSSSARVCILDPTDAWWGLRLMPDGKTPGFPVAIFGGQKGDLALNEHAGETIGTAIATSSQSTIVSMADFVGENARRRFASAFLAALYQHNREPLHLIVDEADTLAPQKPIAPLDAEVLSRMQQIVRRGRIRGFVPYLITQRPAVLNKDVLSQADGLIAFNLTASQDRDAIGAWIEGQADKAEQKALLATLPKLVRGTAMVWLPGRGILKQADFPLSATFDSGRTPKRGEAKPTATLKPIDVDNLASKIAAVEEKRKADDPTMLRKRIKELETELAKKPADAAPAEHLIRDARSQGWRHGRDHGESLVRKMYGERIQSFTAAMEAATRDLLAPMPMLLPVDAPTMPATPSSAPVTSSSRPVVPPRKPVSRPVTINSADISRPQQRILDALAWLESIGIGQADRTRVAMLADASPKSSGFEKNVSTLKGMVLIEYPFSGELRLTEAGRAAANAPASPPTDAELHAAIRSKISGPQWALLDVLIRLRVPMPRAELAERAGVSAASSGFEKNVSTLSGFGFVTYPERGSVQVADILFVER